ncbi:hypothetical protein [Streptomyces sp. NPDC047315]
MTDAFDRTGAARTTGAPGATRTAGALAIGPKEPSWELTQA